jgi:hypothetical protein
MSYPTVHISPNNIRDLFKRLDLPFDYRSYYPRLPYAYPFIKLSIGNSMRT